LKLPSCGRGGGLGLPRAAAPSKVCWGCLGGLDLQEAMLFRGERWWRGRAWWGCLVILFSVLGHTAGAGEDGRADQGRGKDRGQSPAPASKAGEQGQFLRPYLLSLSKASSAGLATLALRSAAIGGWTQPNPAGSLIEALRAAWEDITSTPCNLGMQDKYRRPLFPGRARPYAVRPARPHFSPEPACGGSAHRNPFFPGRHVTLCDEQICGKNNEEMGLDMTGRPCCCEFCGQRDPFEQLCEVSQLVCSTVEDCIQRHHGTCVRPQRPARILGFHIYWHLVVSIITVAPFVIPAAALFHAQDFVLGLVG